jgi:pSer/pThr/pTyr-binding forkhead associated (FHA) protein
MNVRLTVLNGKSAGKVIPVPFFPFIIGRDRRCHLHLYSEFVSKRHCMLFVYSDKLFVSDLRSTNGTLVNGAEVAETELHDGDRLSICFLTLAVQIDVQTDADTPVHEATRADKPTCEPTPRGSEILLYEPAEENAGEK